MRLLVVAGHGAGDSGAVGYGYTEAERVRALANRMKALAPSEVILGDQSRNWYASNLWNTINKSAFDQGIELHMDASTSASARGGHVIITASAGADAYDNALASFISGHFPGRSKSIVQRSDLQNVNVCAARGINYRLLETCFISNADDLARFNADIDAVAKGILAAFGIATEPVKPTVWDGPGVECAGANRYDTALKLAHAAHPNAEHTLITKGASFADTAIGLWMAGRMKAQVLYDPSAPVMSFDGYYTAGANRWGTNKVFNTTWRAFGHSPGNTCFVTMAPDSSFADACAIGWVSYREGIPIILYNDHKDFYELISSYKNVIVIGGSLPTIKGETDRIAGATRSDTAAFVAERYAADWSCVVIATGTTFPDAMAASQLCGNNPLLFAEGDATTTLLAKYRPKDIVWVGGLSSTSYDRRVELCRAAGLL